MKFVLAYTEFPMPSNVSASSARANTCFKIAIYFQVDNIPTVLLFFPSRAQKSTFTPSQPLSFHSHQIYFLNLNFFTNFSEVLIFSHSAIHLGKEQTNKGQSMLFKFFYNVNKFSALLMKIVSQYVCRVLCEIV